MTRAALVLLSALVASGCRGSGSSPREARDVHDAMDELSRCTFGPDNARPDGTTVEALTRRALREDRMAFSVRAGRCATALDPALRERDPHARALGDAWDELLPLAQSPSPDDIALERAIRHVGNAWRDAR